MADIREQIQPEDAIRLIEAYLTKFSVSDRKPTATQIYNALFTIGYRLFPPTHLEDSSEIVGWLLDAGWMTPTQAEEFKTLLKQANGDWSRIGDTYKAMRKVIDFVINHPLTDKGATIFNYPVGKTQLVDWGLEENQFNEYAQQKLQEDG